MILINLNMWTIVEKLKKRKGSDTRAPSHAVYDMYVSHSFSREKIV
jgi:hypothetical protein